MYRRLTAAWVLAAFVAALLLPSVTVTHAWNDPDLAGGESFRLVGHADTTVGAPRPAGTTDHCALCHWLRNLGNSVVTGSVLIVDTSAARPGADAATLSLIAVFGDGYPARGPPSIPFA